jgi:hypothetical protein
MKAQPGMLDKIKESLSGLGQNAKDVGDATLTGLNNGLTLGYNPQIQGALGAGYDALTDNMGSDSLSERYLKRRDQEVAREKGVSDKAPIAEGLAQLAGGAAMPLPGSAETTAGKLALAGARGAGYGALMNPGDKKGEIDPLQLDQRLQNANTGMATGQVLESAQLGAPAALKKGISTFLGPNKEAVDQYLQNRDRINAAPDLETLKDQIDRQVGGKFDALNDTKTQLSGAKNDLNYESKLATSDYRNGQLDAQAQQASAEAALERAKGKLDTGLETTPSPISLAPQTQKAVGDLKQQVVSGSAKARQILADSGDSIQTKPLFEIIDQERQRMLPPGTVALTPQAEQADAALEALQQKLQKLPDSVSGPAAKKLVQQIDDQAQFTREAGGFGSDYDGALKSLRRGIDAQLKENPEYAAQMKEVSRKTQLLDQANDLFGTPEAAHSNLNTIHAPTRAPQRGVLENLGKETGQDFATPVQKFADSQAALKGGGITPIAEGKNADQAGLLTDLLSHPGYKENRISSQVQDTGLPAQIEQLTQQLGKAQSDVEPFKGWQPQQTQGKLTNQMRTNPATRNIEWGRQLEALDQQRPEGIPSYLDAVQDNRTRNAFTREYTQGSRNVNIGKTIGGVAGHMGAAVGAGVGGLIDKTGGAIAKGGLDAYLNNQQAVDLARQNIPRALLPYLETKKDNR